MTIADRLVDAAIAQGPDSAPARLLRELVEACERVAVAEDDDGSRSVPELSDLIDRAWLVAS